MERQIEYSPVRGQSALRAFRDLADLPGGEAVAFQGLVFRDGLEAALINAELMAAEAGAVPLLELPDGQRGVLEVGRARRVIEDPREWSRKPQADPDDVATVYLAVSGAVRQASAFARGPSKGTTVVRPPPIIPAGAPEAALFNPGDLGLGSTGEPGMLLARDVELAAVAPLVIVLVVLGLAATVGTAWYATSTRNVETDADRAVNVAATSELAALAQQQIAQGKPVDPAIVEAMRDLGNREKQGSLWVPIGAGLVGLGIGAAAVAGLATAHKQRGRRAA